MLHPIRLTLWVWMILPVQQSFVISPSKTTFKSRAISTAGLIVKTRSCYTLTTSAVVHLTSNPPSSAHSSKCSSLESPAVMPSIISRCNLLPVQPAMASMPASPARATLWKLDLQPASASLRNLTSLDLTLSISASQGPHRHSNLSLVAKYSTRAPWSRPTMELEPNSHKMSAVRWKIPTAAVWLRQTRKTEVTIKQPPRTSSNCCNLAVINSSKSRPNRCNSHKVWWLVNSNLVKHQPPGRRLAAPPSFLPTKRTPAFPSLLTKSTVKLKDNIILPLLETVLLPLIT